MPLKVRGLLSFLSIVIVAGANAQAQQSSEPVATSNAPSSTASSQVNLSLEDRLARARVLVAARQLSAAAFDLEKIKKESFDETLQSVARVMLVGVYLEMPDYSRVNALLEETFTRSKNRKNDAANVYLPVAGQIVRGAENQIERYKRMGFNLADPKLPAEAAADLDKWRKMLEVVAKQTSEMSMDERRSGESLAVLEEVAKVRGKLARDEYEAAAWRNMVENAREQIAAAQNRIKDVDGTSVDMKNVAQVPLPPNAKIDPMPSNDSTATINQPQSEQPKPAEKTLAILNPPQIISAAATETRTRTANESAAKIEIPAPENKVQDEPAPTVKSDMKTLTENGMMQVGSMIEMATQRFPATYPQTARTARIAGIVKVELVVDENGKVSEAKATAGPEMLRRAALDAARRWKFRPATRDGQPVKSSGFVSFNFTL